MGKRSRPPRHIRKGERDDGQANDFDMMLERQNLTPA